MLKKNVYTILVIYLLMMLIGMVDNVKGPLITSIKTFYSVDYTMMGLFLSIGSFGFILSTFFGGLLADRVGHKLLLIIGTVLIIFGTFGISTSHSFIVFLIFAFIMNMGMGSLEMGINAVASMAFLVNQAVMMNLLHFFYGAGSIISPNMTVKLLQNGFTWQLVYLLVAGLALVFMIVILMVKIPKKEKYKSTVKVNYVRVLKNVRIWLFALMLGFYVSSEIGVGNWAVTFFKTGYKMSNTQSSLYLALFFTTFTFGRLFGGFIVEKLGYIKSLVIFSFTSAILIAAGMMGKNFAFLISTAGFFYSIIFPTVIATVMKEFNEYASVIIGVITTVSSTINMLASFLIGKLNDAFGVYIGFSAILIFMILVALMTIVLSHFMDKNIGNNFQKV